MNFISILITVYIHRVITSQKIGDPLCFSALSLEEEPALIEEQNCTHEMESICRKNLSIAYTEMKPFSSEGGDIRQFGIIQYILKAVLKQCCGKCINLHFNQVSSKTELNKISSKQSSKILFPIFKRNVPHEMKSMRKTFYIPLVPLESAMFLTKSRNRKVIITEDVIGVITSMWPLFIATILIAFLVGLVNWSVSTLTNKKRVRPFYVGIFEGFWCAFMSMTTVGSNDSSHVSYISRLLTVPCILMGITIISSMTAILTTTMNEAVTKQKMSITQSTVGVLNNYVFEKRILSKHNAKAVYKNSISELYDSIENNEIDGILINTHSAKFLLNYSSTEKLNIESIVHDYDQGASLGAIIYDKEIHYLFQRFIESNQEDINDFITNNTQLQENLTTKTKLLLTTNSSLFKPIMIICAVLIILIFIGVIAEIIRRQQKLNKKATRIFMTTEMRTIKEKELQKDLGMLLRTWECNLKNKTANFSIIGRFSISEESVPLINVAIIPAEDRIQQDYRDNTITLKYKCEQLGIYNYMFDQETSQTDRLTIYENC